MPRSPEEIYRDVETWKVLSFMGVVFAILGAVGTVLQYSSALANANLNIELEKTR